MADSFFRRSETLDEEKSLAAQKLCFNCPEEFFDLFKEYQKKAQKIK